MGKKKRPAKNKNKKKLSQQGPLTQNQPLSNAQILKEKGNRAFQGEDYESAIKFYTDAIQEEENKVFYSNRAASYLKKTQWESALADAEKCIQLDDTWVKGYLRKGKALEGVMKLTQAIEVYKKAMELEQAAGATPNGSAVAPVLEDCQERYKRVSAEIEKQEQVPHAQSGKFKLMIDWLIEGGAKFPKLILKYYSSEYRAIHTLTRIASDEEICYIPHDYIMTSDLARASDIGKSIINSKVDLRSKHSYLAAYLLEERKKAQNSRWHIYIDILPKKYETIPYFFGPKLLRELRGSISLQKIADRIDSLRLEYDNIVRYVPHFKEISTHLDFVWARLVVITRIFGLVIDGVKTNGLVPMADMLNHKRPRETRWAYNQPQRGFVITALQTIKAGAEVFDSYGRKCNSRFFVNYGFSLETNRDNEALMRFKLQKNFQQYDLKLRMLGGEHCAQKQFQIPKMYSEKKVKECFSFLRFMHARGPEIMLLSSAEGFRIDDIEPLSKRNEKSALVSLYQGAKQAMKLFDTTLEYDNKLLADENKYPMFSNERNTVLMRRGEKQVLQHFIDLSQVCIKLLGMQWKELKQAVLRKYNNNTEPISHYVNHVVVPLSKDKLARAREVF